MFNGSNGLCDTLVLMAAKSNGKGDGKLTLEQLQMVGESNILQFPALYDDVSLEIIGGRILHIDRKIGDEYKTVCVIEEVEILEMEPVNEENGYGAMAE